MYQRYLTARTYEDQGTLVDVFRPDDGSEPSTTRMTFSTLFDRATGSFRFEYMERHDRFFRPQRHVIWRAGSGRASMWWTIRAQDVESADLDAGLAAMAGVSRGTSRTVPSMLLGWAEGAKRNLGYVADGEGVAGGIPCSKLTAHRNDAVVTLWIGKDDRSLRRVTSRKHLDGTIDEKEIARMAEGLPEKKRGEFLQDIRKPRPFVAEATIDYSPVFDRPVDPSRLEFTPPRATSDDGDR